MKKSLFILGVSVIIFPGIAMAAGLTIPAGGTGWTNFQTSAIPYGINGSLRFGTTTPGTNGFVLAYLNGIPTWAATSSITTSPGGTSGQVQYNANGAFGGVSTTTLSGSGVISISNSPVVIGTSPAVATLTGGTNGQILAWLSGIPTWTASTTLSAGAGISTTFSAGNWTIANTGVTSLTATSPLSRDTATGAVTISCPTCITSVGTFDPFSHTTNFGNSVSATTSIVWFQSGLYASSTSIFTTASSTNASTTGLTVANQWFTGLLLGGLGVDANGKVYKYATTTYSTGLTWSNGAVTCDTASGVVFGCLTAANWTTFNAKQAPGFQISTTSPISISQLAYYTGVTPTSIGGVATGTISAGTGISLNSTVRSVIGGSLQITNSGVTSLSGFDGGPLSGAIVLSTSTVGVSDLEPLLSITASGQTLTFNPSMTGVASIAQGGTNSASQAASNGVAYFNGSSIITGTGFEFDGTRVGIASTTPWASLSITNTTAAPSFVVEDSASPDATPFIVDTTGSVGIGGIPTKKLSVIGGRIQGQANSEPYSFQAEYKAGDGQFYFGATDSSDPDGVFSNFAGAEKMRITTGGSVGIGTTTPWKTLSVVGTMAITAPTAEGSTKSSLCWDPVTKEVLSNAGSSCLLSAAKKKDNIVSIATSTALTNILKLNPVEFSYKADKTTHRGFIADEVALVIPTAAYYDKEEINSYEPAEILATIVKALQDIIARVTGLEKRLSDQQKQIDDLNARLKKLEN